MELMNKNRSDEELACESVPMAYVRILGSPYLRTTALFCIASILRNFFFKQYKAAFFPGRIPVSQVDHPLDAKIPFLPGKVGIYLDFVAFWVRSLGFLLRKFRRRALEPVRSFIEDMGKLYAFAAEVYGINLSTTKRPFYIGSPRFFVIHTVDPHLMCIPSLHVMVVVFAYTRFREMLKTLGEGENFAAQGEELYAGALAITEAILYIKQHSVNCIPAALYAMTCFDPALFPQEEAERFVSLIFAEVKSPAKEDCEEIRDRIISLYRRFLSEGGEGQAGENPGELNPDANNSGPDWKDPILNFLKNPI